jgi:hypothetical protein
METDIDGMVLKHVHQENQAERKLILKQIFKLKYQVIMLIKANQPLQAMGNFQYVNHQQVTLTLYVVKIEE